MFVASSLFMMNLYIHTYRQLQYGLCREMVIRTLIDQVSLQHCYFCEHTVCLKKLSMHCMIVFGRNGLLSYHK